jgi:Ca2+-binding RTX toxin-like protein
MRLPRVRRAALILGALLTMLAVPASASASSVAKVGDKLVYTGDPVANHLSVGLYDADTIEFWDSGSTITSGHCARPETFIVRCPAAGITEIELHGEGGNDNLSLSSIFPAQYIVRFFGGPGNDSLADRSGIAAPSSFDGGPGADNVSAYGGDDYIEGGPLTGDGNDVINAGEGDDIVWGGDGDDYVVGEEGDDLLGGEGGDDTLIGSDGADQLSGGDGNDTLRGERGADVLSGHDGDDQLEPDPTSSGVPLSDYRGDVVEGGAGVDTVGFPYRSQPLKLSLDGQANDGMDGEADDIDADRGVENLQLGRGGSEVVLDDKDNVVTGYLADFYGPSGDDVIDGRGGNDRITTGTGDDVAFGGPGDDRLQDWGGADELYGEDGNDELVGHSTGDLLDPGPGQDVVLGGSGDDVIPARDATADQIGCGGGFDAVVADPVDTVIEGVLDPNRCESVDRGAPAQQAPAPQPAGPPPQQQPQPRPQPAPVAPRDAGLPPTPAVTARLPNAQAIGAFLRGFRVTGDRPGMFTTTVTAARARAAAGSRRTVIATGGVRLARAGSARLKPRLTRAGKRATRRGRSLRVAVTTTFKPSTGATVSRRKTMTLRLRR